MIGIEFNHEEDYESYRFNQNFSPKLSERAYSNSSISYESDEAVQILPNAIKAITIRNKATQK
jgi:hypothetical protein